MRHLTTACLAAASANLFIRLTSPLWKERALWLMTLFPLAVEQRLQSLSLVLLLLSLSRRSVVASLLPQLLRVLSLALERSLVALVGVLQLVLGGLLEASLKVGPLLNLVWIYRLNLVNDTRRRCEPVSRRRATCRRRRSPRLRIRRRDNLRGTATNRRHLLRHELRTAP